MFNNDVHEKRIYRIVHLPLQNTSTLHDTHRFCIVECLDACLLIVCLSDTWSPNNLLIDISVNLALEVDIKENSSSPPSLGFPSCHINIKTNTTSVDKKNGRFHQYVHELIISFHIIKQ